MTIEGLGKKFQEAREERGLTLDEAARMTKIRPSRLAEIEADDFSQFPSLAYAKGFLLIYGKFLDVDVTPYMEAFETGDAVTVDGYSYLQASEPEPAPVRAPVVRRRPERIRPRASSRPSTGNEKTSIMPLILGAGVLIGGFIAMKLVLNLQRVLPRKTEQVGIAAAVSPTPQPTAAPIVNVPTTSPPQAATAPPTTPAPTAVVIATTTPAPATTIAAATATPRPTTAATPAVAAKSSAPEPEVRRAEPVRDEDLAAATPKATAGGANRLAIKPLKRTYVKVVVDDESVTPAFERWISPSDGAVEFRGQKFSVRVLDPAAVQIKKNGKSVSDDDGDVTVED